MNDQCSKLPDQWGVGLWEMSMELCSPLTAHKAIHQGPGIIQHLPLQSLGLAVSHKKWLSVAEVQLSKTEACKLH